MTKPLISIAIPTYNGMKTLPKTIENISQQIKKLSDKKQINICVTDDGSTDDTREYLLKISKRSYINVFFNKKNLGMDDNFQKAALNSNGHYIWFFGQDDSLKRGTLKKIFEVLKDKQLGQLYIDYEQFSEKKKKTVCSSIITTQLKKEILPGLNIYKNSSDYFSYLTDAPSFLPATIISRSYLIDKRLKQFKGTHYVQYATFLLNLNKLKPTGVLYKSLIKGIIPANGWQQNGTKLFEIAVGKLYAQYLVNKLDKEVFPVEELALKKQRFFLQFPKLLLRSMFLGFKTKTYSIQAINKVYGDGLASFSIIKLTKLGLIMQSIINFLRKKQ